MEEEHIKAIEQELALIRERNVRVESEKAWEVSVVRVVSIAVIIYILSCLVLFILKAEHIFVASLVPAFGFFLSTRSLSFVKKVWMRARRTS